MKKDISVIIPTYNRAEFIGECLESVFACLHGLSSEVIVVDDGSTDRTGKIIKKFQKKYGDLRYVPISHTGRPGAVRNVGLREAKGEFIAFQDSDDTWAKDKISKQMSVFDDDTVLVYGNISYINSQGESTSGPIIESGDKRSGYLFSELIGIHRQPVPTSTVIARRSAINKAGEFNDYLPVSTDIEYWIRLSTLGNFKFVNEVLAYIRRHDTNVSTISGNLEGVFIDRLSQIPIYRSLLENATLTDDQKQQVQWAQIQVIDQLKKLSGRYSHSLVKNYDGQFRRGLVMRRWLSMVRDLFSNFVYYIRNI